MRPILLLPIFVALSLAIDEQYPFSDFPMYSDPGPESTYYLYLGDADNLDENGLPTPIPMEEITTVRSAKSKKIYRKALGADKHNPDEQQRAGEELLADVRKRTEEAGKPERLPARLGVVHVEISLLAGEGIKEVPRILAVEP